MIWATLCRLQLFPASSPIAFTRRFFFRTRDILLAAFARSSPRVQPRSAGSCSTHKPLPTSMSRRPVLLLAGGDVLVGRVPATIAARPARARWFLVDAKAITDIDVTSAEALHC